jgi:membrane dipeptidase
MRRAALLAVLLLSTPAVAAPDEAAIAARVAKIVATSPVIDGHNDLPWELRTRANPDGSFIDIASGTDKLANPLHTDIARMRKGGVGAQFWSVWVPVSYQGGTAVQATIEQIDIVKRMAARYPRDFALATTAADVERIRKSGRIASLIGVEGGHQIGDSLAVLRQFHALGVRYMTLTHTTGTPWADSATAPPKVGGLNDKGRAVVREMNRLGMLVDLSHVSPDAMRAAIAASSAPVIFSHSGARGVADHPRNVPDDVLKLIAANGGVVMANFAPGYASEARRLWDAAYAAEKARIDAPPYGGLAIGQPEKAAAMLADWLKANPRPRPTLAQIADHVERIAAIAGKAHVGIGSDYDGIEDTPAGLDGVESFPVLLTEMARRGWTDAELRGLAGDNVLRVMRAVEAEAARQAGRPAITTPIGG